MRPKNGGGHRRANRAIGAVGIVAFVIASIIATGCEQNASPILPPTGILTDYAPWGVVERGYTRTMSLPTPFSKINGHLRRSDLARLGQKQGRCWHGIRLDCWRQVLIDDKIIGWIPEGDISVYPNRVQAQNAASLISIR